MLGCWAIFRQRGTWSTALSTTERYENGSGGRTHTWIPDGHEWTTVWSNKGGPSHMWGSR